LPADLGWQIPHLDDRPLRIALARLVGPLLEETRISSRTLSGQRQLLRIGEVKLVQHQDASFEVLDETGACPCRRP